MCPVLPKLIGVKSVDLQWISSMDAMDSKSPVMSTDVSVFLSFASKPESSCKM